MARGGTDIKPLILIDGNSIAIMASSYFQTAFDNEYGAGNYTYKTSAYGGKKTSEMLDDVQMDVLAKISRRQDTILIANETRNEIRFDVTPPATQLIQWQDYFAAIKAIYPSIRTICILVSASERGDGNHDLLTDIPLTNDLIKADVGGDLDAIIDVYNFSTFDDPTTEPPFADGVHYQDDADGRGLYADYVAAQTKALYPVL